jgi:hypothetical protein
VFPSGSTRSVVGAAQCRWLFGTRRTWGGSTRKPYRALRLPGLAWLPLAYGPKGHHTVPAVPVGPLKGVLIKLCPKTCLQTNKVMMLAAGAGSFCGRVRNGLGLVLPRSAAGAKYFKLTAKWIENMYANRIDCRPAGGYSATAQTPQSACCAPSETAFSDAASVQESAHIAEVGARQDQHG